MCERARAVGLVLALVCTAAPATRGATAHVQYVSSTSIYLDAGAQAGISEGAVLRVERDGKPIGELVVEFVARSSAACKRTSGTVPIRAGDTVVFEPVAGARRPTAEPAMPAAPQRQAHGGWTAGSLRGTVAVSHRRSEEDAATYDNSTLRSDLRWDASERRQITLRLRADRPHVAGLQGSDARSSEPRLYQAALGICLRDETLRAMGGRFVPERLELLGYVDGGAVVVRPASALRLGLAGGRGARLASAGFATEGWVAGGYIEAVDSRRSGAMRWRTLVGGAMIEDADVTRRQFGILRSDVRPHSRIRAWQVLEVDRNPAWKQALGQSAFQLTTAAVGVQVSVSKAVDLSSGFDLREDLLLPEHRDTPVEALRLGTTYGTNAAVHVRLANWAAARVGVDLRQRDDGTRTTRAVDASLHGSHPGLPELTGVVHTNVYDAAPGRGDRIDASLSYRASSFLRFDLAGGTDARRTTTVIDGIGAFGDAPDPNRRSAWFRLGAEVEPGWRSWIEGGAEWHSDPDVWELHVELGERF